MNIIDKAIQEVGTASELARQMGVSRQAVHKWGLDGNVPLKKVPQIAEVTGISVLEFYPEYFGKVQKLLNS